VGALLLDLLIQTGVVIVLGLVFALPAVLLFSADGGAATAVGVVISIIGGLLLLAVALLWQPYFMNREGERNGQTLGKQIVDITVVRDEGERMDLGWPFVRQILVIQGIPWVLNGFAAIFLIPIGTLALLLDYLWPLWDDENRCVHDMIVKTHVVRA